jgi:hypothetical protein
MSAFHLDPTEDVMILDWGDIPADTPVGAASFQTCAFYAEGAVPGLYANLQLFDADNGMNTTGRIPLGHAIRAPLEGSGDVFPYCRNQQLSTVYFQPPLELGDSDGVPAAEGALRNPLSFTDLDGDGRHDFSFSIDFDYPSPLTNPRGQAVLLTGVPAAGLSGGDRLSDLFVGGAYVGTTDLFRNVYLILYGPGCNAADLASPYGLLDSADIVSFVDSFTSGVPAERQPADQAEPIFVLDLNDILTFIRAFEAGCPG